MLAIFLSTIIGLISGMLIMTLRGRKSYKELISINERESCEKNIFYSSLEKIYDTLETTNTEYENSRQNTINMISDAFNTGSEMMTRISDSMIHIQKMVKKTIDPIESIYVTGEAALQKLNMSQQSVSTLTEATGQIESMSASIGELHSHLKQVNNKTQEIHKIADQANLLSLNAAIEAARAGEAGRGFGVVANDMNRLAESSASSARDISQIVSVGLKSIEQITKEMDSKIEVFRSVSENVINIFNDMVESINKIEKMAHILKDDTNITVNDVNDISNDTQTTIESLTKVLSEATGILSGNIITDLRPTEVANRLNDYVIIDVRNQNEFNDDLGHINNATLYCLQDSFKEKINDLSRDDNYLFICRSGGRSARAAMIAQGIGFKHVTNLSGGMLEWRKSFPK